MLALVCIVLFIFLLALAWLLQDPKKELIKVGSKLVVITGGTSGLGLEIAIECLKRNAKVVLLSRNSIEVKDHPRLKDFIGNVFSFSCDVTKREELIKSVEKTKEIGAVEFLFCCAGLSRQSEFENLGVEDIDQQVNVNLVGTINAIYFYLPFMKMQGQGRICIISSVGGQIGLWGMAHYCATKFALRGLTEALQMELIDSNIAATIFFPPDMATPGFEEENRTKPPIANAIAELGGLVEPSIIVKPLINSVEFGEIDHSVGLEGWFCSRQTVGMGAVSSLMNCLAELTLSNVMRFIALVYRKIILNIIRSGKKKTC